MTINLLDLPPEIHDRIFGFLRRLYIAPLRPCDDSLALLQPLPQLVRQTVTRFK